MITLYHEQISFKLLFTYIGFLNYLLVFAPKLFIAQKSCLLS